VRERANASKHSGIFRRSKSAKLLEDIRDAAAFIRHTTEGTTFEDYCANRLLRQAVERHCEIIGEAINRLA
jgi:uncharacterized protein with HEPN domain